MTVEPLEWVSWREARLRMPEIWDGWRYRLADADQALANSLRRGNVSLRLSRDDPHFGAYEEGPVPWLGKKIDLRDVVAGLLNLQTYPSPIRAEYETEVLSHMPGWPPTKHKLKLTAVVFGAELAWDELRNDLIHFELPAGVRPNPPERPKSRRRGRERQSVPAPDREIHQAIAETYDHADAIGEKPPNVNEVIKPVQARLSTRYHASGRRIRELAGDPRYDRRRWTPGMTRSSKKRKVDR